MADFCVWLALGATEVLQVDFYCTGASLLWFTEIWLGCSCLTESGGVLKFMHVCVTWPLRLIIVEFCFLFWAFVMGAMIWIFGDPGSWLSWSFGEVD